MKNRYTLFILIVSISVATLIHFPELVSLFDVFESQTLFPGMRPADVASEVFFTFISLVILFEVNILLFHFNQPAVKITWQKMILSLILTWILSSLLGKCFVFLHHTFDIPAIDAMVHHYLHPLRDFIITCTVSGSCYISYLIRRQQEVVIENQQLQAENILNQYEALKNQLNPHMLFNSLNTLRSLVREDQDKAQEYIHEINSAYDDTIIAAYSGNEMLNSVLSIYHSRFTDRGLSLICNVSTGKELPCSDLSLCTILSNALENSMHALEQLESPSKWARLTLSQKKNHILFQLENPVEKIPAFVDGVPVSTRNGHGIGVRSIIYYVEQLHGQCHFSIVDHCFVLRIII